MLSVNVLTKSAFSSVSNSEGISLVASFLQFPVAHLFAQLYQVLVILPMSHLHDGYCL